MFEPFSTSLFFLGVVLSSPLFFESLKAAMLTRSQRRVNGPSIEHLSQEGSHVPIASARTRSRRPPRASNRTSDMIPTGDGAGPSNAPQELPTQPTSQADPNEPEVLETRVDRLERGQVETNRMLQAMLEQLQRIEGGAPASTPRRGVRISEPLSQLPQTPSQPAPHNPLPATPTAPGTSVDTGASLDQETLKAIRGALSKPQHFELRLASQFPLSHCLKDIVTFLDGGMYEGDQLRISIALTYVGKDCRRYWESVVASLPSTEVITFDFFQETLLAQFDPHSTDTVKHREALGKLNQSGKFNTLQKYFLEFVRLHTLCGSKVPDQYTALMMFRNGMSDSELVRNTIAAHPHISTYVEFARAALNIEKEWKVVEPSRFKKPSAPKPTSTPRNPHPNPNPKPKNVPGPQKNKVPPHTAPEVDKKRQRTGNGKVTKPMPQELWSIFMDNKLCIRCGEQGHGKKECTHSGLEAAKMLAAKKKALGFPSE